MCNLSPKPHQSLTGRALPSAARGTTQQRSRTATRRHKRRNLTADQRAGVGAAVAGRYSELTKARQVAAALTTNEKRKDASEMNDRLPSVKGKRSQETKRDAAAEKEPPRQERTAAALAAKEVGASRGMVERAIAIRKVDPSLADRVTSGEMKLKQAERVAKAPEGSL